MTESASAIVIKLLSMPYRRLGQGSQSGKETLYNLAQPPRNDLVLLTKSEAENQIF